MTLIFKPKNISSVKSYQENKYQFRSIKSIQLGFKNLGIRKVSCGCGK